MTHFRSWNWEGSSPVGWFSNASVIKDTRCDFTVPSVQALVQPRTKYSRVSQWHYLFASHQPLCKRKHTRNSLYNWQFLNVWPQYFFTQTVKVLSLETSITRIFLHVLFWMFAYLYCFYVQCRSLRFPEFQNTFCTWTYPRAFQQPSIHLFFHPNPVVCEFPRLNVS